MPKSTRLVSTLPGKAGRGPAAAPQPRRPDPKRGPVWHAIQLRAAQAAAPAQTAAPSRASLPPTLKAGIERLSGFAMGDVRVHRNSAEPAKLGALAYTQGSDVHLGPGQERHLAHEAWHVVQQKQGRVQATRQLAGAKVNDSAALEAEADVMGARAEGFAGPCAAPRQARTGGGEVVQRAVSADEVASLRAFAALTGAVLVVKNQATEEFDVTGMLPDQINLRKHANNNVLQPNLATFRADYTVVSVTHDGIAIPAKDLRDASDHAQVRNNSQVIDVSKHPLAFAHYSYDLVRTGQAQVNKRDNDHLTIENSLTLFLMKVAKGEKPDDIAYFLEHKPEMKKPDINTELKLNHKLAEMDNFNFRPDSDAQVSRALTQTIDPNSTLRNSNQRKNAASDKVAVDKTLNLLQFVAFLESKLGALKVAAPIIAQIRQSIADEATTRMGFALEELYINKGQIKDLVQFAVILRKLTNLNWLNDPIPPPLLGLIVEPPYVGLDTTDFAAVKDDLEANLEDETYEAIKSGIEADGFWRASRGEPGFAATSERLAIKYWPTVRNWIVNL